MYILFTALLFVVKASEMPLSYDGTYYYVDLILHGKLERFMVDTGAPHSALSKQHFQQKEFKYNSSYRMFGGRKYFYLEHCAYVEHAHNKGKDVFTIFFIKHNIDDLKSYTSNNKTKVYSGILGIDFFFKYYSVINFNTKTIKTTRFIYPPFAYLQGR